MRIASAFIASFTAASLLACATTDKVLDNKTKKGAAIGTLAGAVAGAAIGGHDHRAGGALIGAATGALAGGLIGNYMDKQAQELDAIPGADVTRTEDALLVNFQGQFLFDSGKSTLHRGAFDRLSAAGAHAQQLSQEPGEDHRPHRQPGLRGFNQRLSEERADSVRDYLVHEGVNGSRVSAYGMGEARPLASNANGSGSPAEPARRDRDPARRRGHAGRTRPVVGARSVLVSTRLRRAWLGALCAMLAGDSRAEVPRIRRSACRSSRPRTARSCAVASTSRRSPEWPARGSGRRDFDVMLVIDVSASTRYPERRRRRCRWSAGPTRAPAGPRACPRSSAAIPATRCWPRSSRLRHALIDELDPQRVRLGVVGFSGTADPTGESSSRIRA